MKVSQVIHHFLPKICTERNAAAKLSRIIEDVLPNHTFSSTEHNLYSLYKKKHISLHINRWVKNVNLILAGAEEKGCSNDAIKCTTVNYIKSLPYLGPLAAGASAAAAATAVAAAAATPAAAAAEVVVIFFG